MSADKHHYAGQDWVCAFLNKEKNILQLRNTRDRSQNNCVLTILGRRKAAEPYRYVSDVCVYVCVSVHMFVCTHMKANRRH